MKQLIKIQSLINAIEDFEELNSKYRTTFNYENERTMYAETQWSEKTITYKMLFDMVPNVSVYLKDNTRLKIIDTSEF